MAKARSRALVRGVTMPTFTEVRGLPGLEVACWCARVRDWAVVRSEGPPTINLS